MHSWLFKGKSTKSCFLEHFGNQAGQRQFLLFTLPSRPETVSLLTLPSLFQLSIIPEKVSFLSPALQGFGLSVSRSAVSLFASLVFLLLLSLHHKHTVGASTHAISTGQ